MSEKNQQLENLNSLNDVTPEEFDFLKSALRTIISALLIQGKLDEKRAFDTEYVWSILNENMDMIDSLGTVDSYEDDFIKTAQDAIRADRVNVAIVLIATAIEHRVNFFYRMLLSNSYQLSNDESIDALRSNLHTKLGWLMTLVSGSQIPQRLKSRITKVIELRNSIVHYKWKSSLIIDQAKSGYRKLLEDVESMGGIDSILDLPNELGNYLMEIETKLSPHGLAAEIVDALYKNRGNTQ